LYETDPTAVAREKELASAVFGKEIHIGDSQMRRTVGALRKWLAKYFDEHSTDLSRRIEIRPKQYRLEFVPIERPRPPLPTDWFWKEYLTSQC
jgi:hypothetical protein